MTAPEKAPLCLSLTPQGEHRAGARGDPPGRPHPHLPGQHSPGSAHLPGSGPAPGSQGLRGEGRASTVCGRPPPISHWSTQSFQKALWYLPKPAQLLAKQWDSAKSLSPGLTFLSPSPP